MIRLIPGEKGEGKTKQLIDMANTSVKTSKGNIVYLDADNSHIYTLKHQIRYIDLSEFPISSSNEFFGFLCGMISEDNDISEIYIDGILKLANIEEIDESTEFIDKLKGLSEQFQIDFIITISCSCDKLPSLLQEHCMA